MDEKSLQNWLKIDEKLQFRALLYTTLVNSFILFQIKISLQPISKLNGISFYLMMLLLFEFSDNKQDERNRRASTS